MKKILCKDCWLFSHGNPGGCHAWVETGTDKHTGVVQTSIPPEVKDVADRLDWCKILNANNDCKYFFLRTYHIGTDEYPSPKQTLWRRLVSWMKRR